ncbi:hypothetical protein MYCTH_2293986 [Thermothelomyces thermophilus ATCC 42464]|uniref:SPRY domain-containing protein n=1 Tax=Thermothelomyces thermophilus (strain ATCC 42464 / BCRC 31852 / DSM 1799) TaxID=573729 RepID=G2Q6S0_THET4|nr:uncharacterized protein MYCTH_2293986 [Thermothelomyces thermophilus ATCC 42464]AEO53100.1 hypothetical protein MYCTH_2293986 [Thermothelomyces thermophilus ATCC 42464]
MCFGSKKDVGDGEAPRPAQNQQQQDAPEHKIASVPPQYHPQQQQSQFQQPAGPPPSHRPPASSGGEDYAPPPGPPPGQRHGDGYGPPPGPPPGQRPAEAPLVPSNRPGDDFAPPPGPPPSHRAQQGGDDFAPPPGPPPGHGASGAEDYAPPPGPPPSHLNNLSYVAPPPGPPPADNKPQHAWEAVVPDTSLFPPPPSFFSGFDRSPANNATEAEAEAGEQWCAQHPLIAPITLDDHAVAALNAHNPRLMQPDVYRGTLTCTAPGVWEGRTNSQATDSTIIAYPPLYSVMLHSPLAPSNAARRKTIYYEVQLTQANPRRDICLAMGFTALPYPSFRMPGWHRGSLAVHGDDGHKFINDRWGGKSFTTPFAPGERLGIGMTFWDAGGGRVEADVFFTRQGREVGRWNLHEETDAEQDLPVTGLEGYHDLSCAIGTCGETGFQVIFDPARWLHRPAGY